MCAEREREEEELEPFQLPLRAAVQSFFEVARRIRGNKIQERTKRQRGGVRPIQPHIDDLKTDADIKSGGSMTEVTSAL